MESNGQKAKPSREVRVSDLLRIRNDAGEFLINVLVLSEMRGPAAVAQTLYSETDTSKEMREKAAEERKAMHRLDLIPQSKPSKRDRRELDRLRGRG